MHWPKTVLVIGVVGFCVTGPGPQAASPRVWAEEGFTVAYVDMAKLFDGYERTRRSETILERKGRQKESELGHRLDELKKLRGGLDLLSDQVRDTRAREIDQKADELRRFGNYTKRDLVRERDQIAQEILTEIRQVVQDYAKAGGFSLVLDERFLLYGQEAYDITEEVLKQLNARYLTRARHSRD